jgi:hypothetical protein
VGRDDANATWSPCPDPQHRKGGAEANKTGVRDAAPAAPHSAIGPPPPSLLRPVKGCASAGGGGREGDVLRDRRCESWSLGGARRLLSLISGVRVPFDRGPIRALQCSRRNTVARFVFSVQKLSKN